MENNVFALRASVRDFLPDEVPQELIEQLLHAATQAPSAGNLQPWHFYVVKKTALKEQLSACAYGQKSIASAPVVIVVCAEPAMSSKRYEARGETLYCLQDTAAATENILLCAAQNGLGTCWCGAFKEEAVSQAMALPAARRPVAILPIGYPAKPAKKPARRPMKDTVTTIE
ncbi:nitroreductase family protein [Ruminococcaceae bacterium OttesenSCG-928-O06]|nr:nitroreductase family protein [Ruminococcaceae bacterium OttesenSCG-928-O06]